MTGLARFPFPFEDDDPTPYRMNLRPHDGSGGEPFRARFDIDSAYGPEIAAKARTLAADPARCQVLPHMRAAEWDALELIAGSLAADFPGDFTLERRGAARHWINRRLGTERRYEHGVASSLPCAPFAFIARQAQGDFTLQDQRGGDLHLDGGMVTQPADWSLDFDLGMRFDQWHAPVPGLAAPALERARQLLLGLRPGQPMRRTNWGITVGGRLDTSPETHAAWGADRDQVTEANLGERLHLRVELQAFFRLVPSHAILFSIRTYLAPLGAVATVPLWRRRLCRVMESLDPAIAEYKGLTALRPRVVAFLREPP